MHSFIDDLAWIAIALVVVTLLFMAGAAVILLDEGLRAIVRKLRKRAAAPREIEPTTNPNMAPAAPLKRPGRALARAKAWPAGPFRSGFSAISRTLRLKLHAGRPGTLIRPHIGHHK